MTPLVRYLALVGLTIWVGGFTFYSAVVIPILHDAMASRDAGEITRTVTDRLNALGVGVLVVGWFQVVWEREWPLNRRRRARVVLLTATTLLLALLIVLHVVMDRHLAHVGLRGFYPWHRVYLTVSTVQWFVNLGLLALPPGVGPEGVEAASAGR